MTPIDFSNMLGKPLRHCFVPADRASITFVFEDGMRRSFGAVNDFGVRISPCSKTSTVPSESGLVFTRVDYPLASKDGASFISSVAGILFAFPAEGQLIELPE